MAPKRKPAAPKAPKVPRAPKGSTAQKPLATGDVDQFPPHAFRADMGQGIPPQKDHNLNPDRAK